MSVIHTALQRLHASIGNLENAMDGYEDTVIAGQQRDMFAEVSNQNEQKVRVLTEKNDMIAERLDDAIERVEKILQKGA